MTFTLAQERKLLIILLVVLGALIVFRLFTPEEQKTAPLTYTRGMTSQTPVRKSVVAGKPADPVSAFLEQRVAKYPGVVRDIFRMSGDGAVHKQRPIVTAPAPTLSIPTPTISVKTPEEIAADSARADLSKFRFLGYLTDKDSSLFLSKDGELYIVKSGDVLLKGYKVKDVGKDYVILQDTATKVEVRVELSGTGK